MRDDGSTETIEVYSAEGKGTVRTGRVARGEEEWRRMLAPGELHVLREKGTERAFTGPYRDTKAHGVYRCAACRNDLFLREARLDSGTGWPGFRAPVSESNVRSEVDRSLLSFGTEVLCARCGSHLGHVFPDGPRPTGMRCCMNSAALDLVPVEAGPGGK